jgi:eukaryotic-like serine/threonine-protein kinase
LGTPRNCPECGCGLADDAPLGLCPGCLIGMALDHPCGDEFLAVVGVTEQADPTCDARTTPDKPDGATTDFVLDGNHRLPALDNDVDETEASRIDGANPDPFATRAFSQESGAESEPSVLALSIWDGTSPPGYAVLEELGRGGMGVVYKANQTKLNRLVALKMIRGGGEINAAQLERFRIEAEALARLRHPNVVQIFEVGEVMGRPYFSLELLEGGSLEDKIDDTPQTPRSSAQLLATLGLAVQAAHEAGVIHRDLKPQNVLFDRDGSPKITDFGLAKRLDVDSGLTMTMQVMGTPSYMAPEQALGLNREIGPAADIYALGAILYTMLTGRPPLKGTDWRETLKMVADVEPVPPSRLQPKVPRDLETICLKCLAKAPHRRYASAGELADDLRRYADGRTILARRTPAWERGVKWTRRHPMTTTLTTLALAASILAVAVFAKLSADAGRRAKAEENRVAQVSDNAVKELLETDDLLTRGDLEQARLVLTRLETTLEPEPRLDQLHRRATDKLKDVNSRLGDAARTVADRARYQRFGELVDEALLQDTMAVAVAQTGKTDTARSSARAALELFGGLGKGTSAGTLAAADQEKLASDRYTLHLVLAGAVARPQPGEDPIRQAREALEILNHASAVRPPSRAYHISRASCLQSAGDDRGASGERALAERLEPSSAFDQFLLGLERHQAGDLPTALRHFDAALSERPDLFWSRLLSAIDLLNSVPSSPGEAKANLTACLAQKSYPWLYLLRGSAFGKIGDATRDEIAAEATFDAALADFRKATELGLDAGFRYVLHMNRGVVRYNRALRRLNRIELALAVTDFEQAVKLEPSKDQPLAALAKALDLQGRKAEALARLDHAIKLNSTLASHYSDRSWLRGETTDPAIATLILADLDEAIRREPPRSRKAAEDLARKARILLRSGRHLEALAAADSALAIADLSEAHRDRVEALLELRRYDDVISSCDALFTKGRPSVELHELDALFTKGRHSAELHELRGLARIGRGDFPAAIADYTQALSIQPDWVRVLVLRGRAYLDRNATELARADFEHVLKVEANNPDGHAGRGEALVRLSRHKEAVAEADRALKLGAPVSSRLYYAAARIYALAHSIVDAEARRRGRVVTPEVYRYEARAVELLTLAIEKTPADERAKFLTEIVEKDAAMNTIRRRARPLPASSRALTSATARKGFHD